MSKAIDLVGQKFGYLTVLERAEKPKDSKSTSAFWLCECNCGKKKIISSNVLRQGKAKSCGCMTSQLLLESHSEDLTGRRFGSLMVLQRAKKPEHTKSSGAYWLCKCDCGNEKIIMGKSLRQGHTKTCGCHYDKITSLIGKRFGKLVVIQLDSSVENRGNGAYWVCRCDCGNFTSVSSSNLNCNSVNSCGCLISKGEEEIRKILVENQIEFKSQYSFSNLNSKKGYPLRFDFALFKEGSLNRLIEFQGMQHFLEDSKFFDADVLERDEIKRQYCKDNNITLIEIPYTRLGKITLEELLRGNEEE